MNAEIDGYWRNHIDGRQVDASDGGRITVNDPATGRPLAEVAKATPADVDRAVAAARRVVASRALVAMRPIDRGRMIVDMGRKLRARSEEIARLISVDAGKPISEARSEVEGSARYLEYYGGAASMIEGTYIPLGDDYTDYVVPVPRGVVAHVIPWNYPNNMVARSLAPALAAGNANVIKSAELDPLSAFVFAELAEEVGFPPGTVNVLCGNGAEAGAALVAHADIDLVVFTGSVETGRAILRATAEHIVPCVLELGGKSAGIVCADANLDAVLASVRTGLFENSGQICDALSRLIVLDDVHDEVVDRVVAMTDAFTMGPGLEDADITPLISGPQLDRVERFALGAVQAGGSAASGGRRVAGRDGHYMAPTVLTGVTPSMRVAQEEVFGPVLSVLRAGSVEEAVAIANGTRYGLAAGVFTGDLNTAMWCTERLEAGQVRVNEWGIGGCETPFGGFRYSGIGREKGLEGLRNYHQSKNVGIRRLPRPRAV